MEQAKIDTRVVAQDHYEPPESFFTQALVKNHLAILLLKALLILAVLYTLYFCKLIVLPILIASFLALFASPLVRVLVSAKLPKQVASVLVIVCIVSALIYVSGFLIEPATRWLQSAPMIGDRLVFEIKSVSEPMGLLPDSVALTSPQEGSAIDKAMDSTVLSIATVLAQSTFILLAQLSVIVILTYFFLAYGEDLMRNIVRAQGSFADKKLTVVVFQAIRDDVSMYILVISCINIGLGLATAGALALIDFEDVLLWGALAAILNFAPYVGPLTLAFILTAVGFAEGESLWHMLIAPSVFLSLNLIESQFVTPTVLGSRFNINPLLVVLWMLIWGWIWGAAGMLLAIPILMCFKIMAMHMDIIGSWAEVLNGVGKHEKREPEDVQTCKSIQDLEKTTK